MSLMVRFGIRSFWLAGAELILFLGLSAAYFLGLPRLYQALFGGAAPGWLWFVLGLLYLLIVTIWWSPGEQADNDVELRALTVVFLLAIVVAGVYAQAKHQMLSKLFKDFWYILSTQGGRHATAG